MMATEGLDATAYERPAKRKGGKSGRRKKYSEPAPTSSQMAIDNLTAVLGEERFKEFFPRGGGALVGHALRRPLPRLRAALAHIAKAQNELVRAIQDEGILRPAVAEGESGYEHLPRLAGWAQKSLEEAVTVLSFVANECGLPFPMLSTRGPPPGGAPPWSPEEQRAREQYLPDAWGETLAHCVTDLPWVKALDMVQLGVALGVEPPFPKGRDPADELKQRKDVWQKRLKQARTIWAKAGRQLGRFFDPGLR